MKFRKTFAAITVFLVIMLLGTSCSPPAEYGSLNPKSEAAKEVGAKGQEEEPKLSPTSVLEVAKEEFQKNNVISDTTIDRIRQNKSSLLPAIKAGLRLDNLGVNSNQSVNLGEWDFWLDIARALNDQQLIPSLTEWLTTSRPIPNSYRLVEVLNALIPTGQENVLIKKMDQATSEGMTVILDVLQQKGTLSEQQIDEWAQKYEEEPQILGIIGFLSSQNQSNTDRLKTFYNSLNLSQAAKRKIVDSLISDYNYRQHLAWLKDVAVKTTDTYVEQMIDQKLVLDSGNLQAAERLHESGTNKGFQVPLRSDVVKILVKQFPDGNLAEGIKRYEALRGQAYFYGYNDGWYKAEGNDFDNPEQGIKGWLAFIKDFPLHPAADDAAYRLARCYQMTGQYAEALYWFNRATQTVFP